MTDGLTEYLPDIPPDIREVICRISMSVTVDNVKKQVSTGDFLASLVINYDRLQDELEKLPALYSFMTMILAESEAQVNLAKKKSELIRSTLHSGLIGRYNEETQQIERDTKQSTDKLPQWQAKHIVESDEELNRADVDYIIKRKNYVKIKGIVDALRMKSDHLRSLSGFKRQEMKESG